MSYLCCLYVRSRNWVISKKKKKSSSSIRPENRMKWNELNKLAPLNITVSIFLLLHFFSVFLSCSSSSFSVGLFFFLSSFALYSLSLFPSNTHTHSTFSFHVCNSTEEEKKVLTILMWCLGRMIGFIRQHT